MAETKTKTTKASPSKSKKNTQLEYKGRPLRRYENMIYYGSMADKYIVVLQVLDSKTVNDMEVATKVAVSLQLTDKDVKTRDKVVRKSEKESLYTAMDLAAVWLERALAGK